MKNLVKTYKIDIIYLAIIILTFTICLFVFWKYQGPILIDTAIDPYLSQEILRGKLYIKDYPNFYGPFSYQINALLLFILGNNLNTFYFIGIVLSLSIILTLYLIARTITKPLYSFVSIFVIVSFCVFNNYFTLNGFILPYTYSILYALTAFLLSVLLCLYYIKSSKELYIILSGVLLSISIISKYEYSCFVFVFLALIVYFKPVTYKTILKTFLASIIIPIISWGSLFVQGVNFEDILKNYTYLKQYLNTNSLKELYLFIGVYPSLDKYLMTIKIFILALSTLSILILFIYFCYRMLSKLKPVKRYIVVSCVFILLLVFKHYIESLVLNYNAYILLQNLSSFLPTSSFIILILLLIHFYRPISTEFKTEQPQNKGLNRLIGFINSFKQINTKEQCLIFTAVCGLVASIKQLSFSSFYFFGAYLMPLNLIINVIFTIEYFPKIFKKLRLKQWNKVLCTLFIGLSLLFLFYNFKFSRVQKVSDLKTKYGTMYDHSYITETLQKTTDYLFENTPDNSTLLVIPRGCALNFLINRSTGCPYIFLDNIIIETMGEEKIINDLKKSPPDYILITNEDLYHVLKPCIFGVHFGLKVNNYIKSNYKLEKVIGKDFNIKIFKK